MHILYEMDCCFFAWVNSWLELCESIIGILSFGIYIPQISTKFLEWRILRSISKMLNLMKKERLKDKRVKNEK